MKFFLDSVYIHLLLIQYTFYLRVYVYRTHKNTAMLLALDLVNSYVLYHWTLRGVINILLFVVPLQTQRWKLICEFQFSRRFCEYIFIRLVTENIIFCLIAFKPVYMKRRNFITDRSKYWMLEQGLLVPIVNTIIRF